MTKILSLRYIRRRIRRPTNPANNNNNCKPIRCRTGLNNTTNGRIGNIDIRWNNQWRPIRLDDNRSNTTADDHRRPLRFTADHNRRNTTTRFGFRNERFWFNINYDSAIVIRNYYHSTGDYRRWNIRFYPADGSNWGFRTRLHNWRHVGSRLPRWTFYPHRSYIRSGYELRIRSRSHWKLTSS